MSSTPGLVREPDGDISNQRGKKRKWHKRLMMLVLFLALVVVLNSVMSRIYDYWDVGSNSWFSRFTGENWSLQRGAAIMGHANQFGDQYTSVRYLWQGWSPAESLWFYNTTQGSDLIPYDLFIALNAPNGSPFHSSDNLYAYGYLPQLATRNNPDSLPVGFVKDTYRKKKYLGFTCAACHTGQVNYKGVGIRIDGGPGGADMNTLMHDLATALNRVSLHGPAQDQFVQRVLARKEYSSREEVLADLNTFTLRLNMYNLVNHSDTPYGYFRLDAFGRIYNRVLEHILTQDQLRATMQDMVRDGKLTQAQFEAINGEKGDNVLTGKRRDHLVLRLAEQLKPDSQNTNPERDPRRLLAKELFNFPDAPVSYPYLWDVPETDYVQWNGLAANSALGPVGRNTGEVIGVFATLDWRQDDHVTLSSLLDGQGFNPRPISFESSVNVHNLRRIEHQLDTLQSPRWPEDILPKIDQQRADRGRVLFAGMCSHCHSDINPADPQRRVVSNITALKDIRTDGKMAGNAGSYTGHSGILRNSYTQSGAGSLLINERAPVVALLTKATLSTVATPSPSKGYIRRFLDWGDDLITSFLSNKIKPSIKQGNYDPDTTANPYASLLSYKARPLNGIWATAPYLHNGSVPTLYDLLLPRRDPTKDPPNGEYRPEKFMVGSREFDPVKVGLRSEGYDGFLFDTNMQGNSNDGHNYGTKGLTKEERLDLVEYLKTL